MLSQFVKNLYVGYKF